MFEHAINKECFEITCTGEEQATAMQREIAYYTSFQFNKIIDSVLSSQFENNDQVVINRLEIDLGDLLQEDFGTDAVLEKFRNIFLEEVTRAARQAAISNRIESKNKGGKKRVPEEIQWQLLQSFVKHGDLPWWADKNDLPDFDKDLKMLITDHPESFREMLDEWQKDEQAIWRLKASVRPSTWKRVEVLLPALVVNDPAIAVMRQWLEAFKETSFADNLPATLKPLLAKRTGKVAAEHRELLTAKLASILRQIPAEFSSAIRELAKGSKNFYRAERDPIVKDRRKSLESLVGKLTDYEVEFLLFQLSLVYDKKGRLSKVQVDGVESANRDQHPGKLPVGSGWDETMLNTGTAGPETANMPSLVHPASTMHPGEYPSGTFRESAEQLPDPNELKISGVAQRAAVQLPDPKEIDLSEILREAAAQPADKTEKETSATLPQAIAESVDTNMPDTPAALREDNGQLSDISSKDSPGTIRNETSRAVEKDEENIRETPRKEDRQTDDFNQKDRVLAFREKTSNTSYTKEKETPGTLQEKDAAIIRVDPTGNDQTQNQDPNFLDATGSGTARFGKEEKTANEKEKDAATFPEIKPRYARHAESWKKMDLLAEFSQSRPFIALAGWLAWMNEQQVMSKSMPAKHEQAAPIKINDQPELIKEQKPPSTDPGKVYNLQQHTDLIPVASDKIDVTQTNVSHRENQLNVFEPVAETMDKSGYSIPPVDSAPQQATAPSSQAITAEKLAENRTAMIRLIGRRLGNQDAKLLQYLQALTDQQLEKIDEVFARLEREKNLLRKLIAKILTHPYLLQYNLLAIYVNLEGSTQFIAPGKKRKVKKQSQEPSGQKDPIKTVPSETVQESSGKAMLLSDDLSKKIQLPVTAIRYLLKNLSLSERIVLRDILEKGVFETASEKRVMQKLLRNIPAKGIELISVLTTLPEEEIRQLAFLGKKIQLETGGNTESSPHLYPGNEPGKIYVENAGLVLIAVYIRNLFKRLGYLDNGLFKTKMKAIRALHILQYMATGKKKTPEYVLQLNKILCGFHLEDSFISGTRLTKTEMSEADNLLESVIENWKILKNTSIGGLRESFLQRKGILLENESHWALQVEKKGYDMMLNTIPWGFTLIKMPWMKKHIQVEW